MSGPLGIMSVVLLEGAVGGAFVLWASGVWGAVKRGFFLLTGTTIALCALGALQLLRTQSGAGTVPAAGVWALGAFTVLAWLWQGLLLARRDAAARAVGLAASVAGVASLVPVAALGDAGVASSLVQLALGSLFLGSTVFGLLLGHWYLVERRLPGVYMVRGARWYAAGVVAAAGAAALSAGNPATDPATGFSPVLAVPGFSIWLAGGLVAVCALIAGFVWRLAGEGGRSIQAATGMFYLAVIMGFSAEMSAKLGFF
ncbi:MAG: hypothetical protein M3N17_04855 [Actinomycetota bacterium]|nr:hypothetical protein [Actinomycetota bacterium]